MMLLVKIKKQAMKQGHYLLRLKCRYPCQHQWQLRSTLLCLVMEKLVTYITIGLLLMSL